MFLYTVKGHMNVNILKIQLKIFISGEVNCVYLLNRRNGLKHLFVSTRIGQHIYNYYKWHFSCTRFFFF